MQIKNENKGKSAGVQRIFCEHGVYLKLYFEKRCESRQHSIRCIFFVSFSNGHGIMIDSMHVE